jgi:hypothetical protein
MVLHFVEVPTARNIVDSFAKALAPGSYVIISVGSGDDDIGGRLAAEYPATKLYNHSPEEIASFFGDFKLQPPGLVDAHDWNPDSTIEPREHSGGRILAGVGRLP